MTLGKTTARAALDQELEPLIAEVTGLRRGQVKRRLSEVHGRQQVRNVFVDEWPRDPGQLAELRLSVVRKAELYEELAVATELRESEVRSRLEGVHGRTLVRNVLGVELFGWDELPEETGAEPYEDDEEEGGAGGASNDRYFHDAGSAARQSWTDGEAAVVQTAPQAPVVVAPSGRPVAEGTTLRARYRLGRLLGEGGFGVVFEARDELMAHDVVVKLPRAEEHEALLRTEAELTWTVHHPGVCRTWLDTDPACGLFLVSEHAGRSVADWIDASGPLPPEFAMHVVTQIASALDYAHERSVVHLDVSCTNVLIDEEGFAKLIDFGAGRAGRRVLEGENAGTVVATAHFQQPVFAAPEQLAGQGRPRSDQYALALVLVSMLRGRVMTKRYELVHDDARFEMPGLHPLQRSVVERALDFSPRDRFPTCGAFAEALVAFHEAPDDLLARRTRDLYERLEKVLEGTDRTTMAVGQAMRAAGAFESYLRAVAVWLAGSEQALRARLDRPIERATCGQLAQAIVSLSGEPNARRPEVAWLVDDLRSRRGVGWQAVVGRNDVAHGRATTLPAMVAVELASKLSALVAPRSA
ncbi:MAG: serine/threonine protein kinase [Sandaracinus sp.]|nr:serine/threonine protein kinase [Sandaracinus sp.]